MRFFEQVGIPLIGSYGLTECGGVTVCGVGEHRPGNLGKPFANVELRIGEDGEILVRGPTVTPGYFKDPEATRQALDANGWFHTGDLGSIDEDGYLTIAGRKKDLIVTSGGKKIAPQLIEDELRRHPHVSQAVLLGEGRPYCVAVVTLRTTPPADRLPQIKEDIRGHIEEMNKHLASFETIKRFALMKPPLTVESGLLTPTLKVKRKAVYARFGNELEALYT